LTSTNDPQLSLDRSSGRASFLMLTARCARVAPITAPAVTIPSYTVGYDDKAGRSSSGDVGATCLIRIQFRCSAAKAALRFTKSSKLKRARRPSIRKLHAGSAKGRSPPAKGNSSLNTFSCGKRAALIHGGPGKVFCGQNPLRGARNASNIKKAPANVPRPST
jgi:hypothetical protein